MPICPVCKKTLKTEMGLEGHIRLSGDIAHEQYRGYKRPSRVSRTSTKRKEPKDITRKDVERIVQRVMGQPKQQHATTVEQVLSEEQQKINDLKAERELLELLKQQMDGWPHHDNEIIDRAPESIQRELREHHLSLV